MLMMVVMKLTAPRILLIPARCREKIVRSIDESLWLISLDKGGYTVHPEPGPDPCVVASSRRDKDALRSQKLRLLRRGKDISGAIIIIGTSQLPNPPIIIGITTKKIIIKAWEVTMTLYRWSW
jgi:hypothetical protein